MNNEPPSSPPPQTGAQTAGTETRSSLKDRFRLLLRRAQGRPTIEEAVETLREEAPDVGTVTENSGAAPLQQGLLANVLSLQEKTVGDCMTPRADILAIDADTEFQELVAHLSREGHTRLPVYRGRLDDVIGMVHLKDVFKCLAEGRACALKDLVREVLFVPTAMPVGRLLMLMKQKRQHLAMVVDEFGGIDGLVTFEDLVEEIFGEIEDEHDETARPQLVKRTDDSWIADARTPIEIVARETGLPLLDEMGEIDTLGGLVFALAGRIPTRGEIVRHPSGVLFEIIETDQKRIRRLLIRNLPPLRLVESPEPRSQNSRA